jgi:hypothetical protein
MTPVKPEEAIFGGLMVVFDKWRGGSFLADFSDFQWIFGLNELESD